MFNHFKGSTTKDWYCFILKEKLSVFPSNQDFFPDQNKATFCEKKIKYNLKSL